MWQVRIERKAVLIWIAFLTVYLALLAALYPEDASQTYRLVFLVNYFFVFVTVFILMMYRRIYGFDILDPIYLITFVYGWMFFVTPIYDISCKNYLWFGYELFGTGIRASIYAMIGYISFLVLFVFGFKKERIHSIREPDEAVEQAGKSGTWLIMVMFVFCFLANMYYLTRNGCSWLYVLTLGIFGNTVRDAEVVARDLGFLAMFSYCLPAIVLLYWEYGTNRFLKISLFSLMLVMQVARGFRFFVIQIIITFITYVSLRRNKRPGIKSFLITIVVSSFPLLIMTLFRDSLRLGANVQYLSVEKTKLQKAFNSIFWSNFQIYHNFYGMIARIPSRYPYVYFRQIVLGTAIMLIPRILWPGKLPSAGGEDLSVLIGARLKGTGQAYPCIGEFYYAFGVIGIIVFMALYGFLMRLSRDRFLTSSRRPLDQMTYSILLGVNLQIIIRGYTPSNFWYVVFSLLPLWIYRFAIGSMMSRRRVEISENTG